MSLFSKIMPNFWQLATTPIFKIQQYSWFLAKDLSWKLHNWYCHNTITYSQIFHSFNTVSSTNHLFLINYTSTTNVTTSWVCQRDLPGIGIWNPEIIGKFQIWINYVIILYLGAYFLHWNQNPKSWITWHISETETN